MTTYNFTTFDAAIQAKLNTASVSQSAQDYLLLAKAVQTAIETSNGVTLLSLKGTANGVAGLDASGQIPLSQLINAIPTQSGNSGKFLTTNGSSPSWATVDAFPSQSGNANKVLKTTGTVTQWTDTLALASISTTGNTTVGTKLYVGTGANEFDTSAALTSSTGIFNVISDADSYGQLSLHNSTSTSSSDVIAYASNGNDSSGWIDMGITGEDFNQATFGITGPNDGYIFMQAPETFTETVTNKALTSNVATLTVGANNFRVGMPVVVSGVDATFNGTYTITAVTGTTFSYAKTASNVTSTAASGTAVAGKTGAGNLVLATGSNGTDNKIVFAAGGYDSGNEQMSITPDENVHIEIPTPSTSPTTGALTVVGGVGISGDLNIQGNVGIQGTIAFAGAGTTVQTANLSVTDPLIFVGKDNVADISDLGIIGEYSNTVPTITRTVSNKALVSNVATITTSATHGFAVGDYVVVSGVDATFNGTYLVASVPTTTTFTYAKTATNVTSASATGSAVVSSNRRFSGIVRDASDGVIKTFKNATTKPTSTINFSESGIDYADVRIAGLTASSASITSATIGSVTNTEIGYLSGVTSSIQTQIGTKLSSTTAASTYAPLASPTLTNAVLSGTTSVSQIFESANVSATAATGVVNVDLLSGSVYLYTSNASGDFTFNLRGNSSTSLNSILSNGQSVSFVFGITNGSTAYKTLTTGNGALTIDGVAVTPKWQGGSAPAAGSTSSVDFYTFTIIKTGSATYSAFAGQVRFA